MRKYVITLRESPDARAACEKHLADVGFEGAEFWYGLHAKKWGLLTSHVYDVDRPDNPVYMGPKQVGCHLSHWVLWQRAQASGDDVTSIMEDDVSLAGDWKPRLNQILEDARLFVPDWDILFLGSCHALCREKTHIHGCLWDLRYPLCTHWYLVRQKALPTLIETQEDSWAPVDLSLFFRSLPKLKVVTAIPRLAAQSRLEIPE